MIRRFVSSVSNSKSVVVSGIQPSGVMHLGNYFGAVANWVSLQDDEDKECFFSIVDLHAITTKQEPDQLRTAIRRMAALLIACGINPDKSILFQQSTVPHHTLLSWILGTMTTIPKLSGLPQFKDKSQGIKDVPLGLLAYPVLQSADILLYRANLVPVGEDQMQQIHLSQHLTQKFNHRFKTQFFPTPKPLLNSNRLISRVKSLRNPEKKMSKSDVDSLSRIELLDPPELIVKKIKKAVTDFTSSVTFDTEKRPGVSNLILIDSLISGKDTSTIVEESSLLETAQYKIQLADRIIEYLKPIQEKTHEILHDVSEVDKVLKRGTSLASERAEKTMKQVRTLMGFE